MKKLYIKRKWNFFPFEVIFTFTHNSCSRLSDCLSFAKKFSVFFLGLSKKSKVYNKFISSTFVIRDNMRKPASLAKRQSVAFSCRRETFCFRSQWRL